MYLTSRFTAPDTRCLEKCEIPTVTEFDEIRRGSYILRNDSNDEICFVIRDLEKISDFDQNYHFTIFKKIRIFPGFIVALMSLNHLIKIIYQKHTVALQFSWQKI